MLEQQAGHERRLAHGLRTERNPGIADLLVERYQIIFIEPNRARVLPNVAGIINSAWESCEITGLDCFEVPHAELSGIGDGMQADALLRSPDFNAEDAAVFHNFTDGSDAGTANTSWYCQYCGT